MTLMNRIFTEINLLTLANSVLVKYKDVETIRSEEHSETSQTSKMEPFAKIVNG